MISTQRKSRETTDLGRWRLKDDDSRHTWHYLADNYTAQQWPQSHAEKYYLDWPLVILTFGLSYLAEGLILFRIYLLYPNQPQHLMLLTMV